MVLLALVCVAGTELAACRWFAPELYRSVTAPVRQACADGAALAGEMAQQLSARVSAARSAWTAVTAAGDTDDGQEADEPVLLDAADYADPSVTEFQLVDGQEMLTGGLTDIVYFNQGDERWASQPYGRDSLDKYGCGPTAMAMAVATLTGADTDPETMAQLSVKLGDWASKGGSYLSIVPDVAEACGLEAESFSGRTPDELCDALLNGKLLVALMGPGHFTKRGHFILLRGYTLDGKLLVADPNSRERSLTLWDPQLVLDELSTSTADGAPLWALSVG
jgi:hypothetical protein